MNGCFPEARVGVVEENQVEKKYLPHSRAWVPF